MGLEGSQKKKKKRVETCVCYSDFINTATGTTEDVEVKKWKAGGC